MEKSEYRAMYEVEDTHWWFATRRLFLITLLRAVPHNQQEVVDIGSGTGGMIRFLREYGHVIGIEPNMTGRLLAKKRGIVLRLGDAEHTKLASKSVDMVCFFDVLYHRGIDDAKALLEANRILRPGGWLVITDCALPFLEGPHDQVNEARERYTLPVLSQKVLSAGFLLQKQTYMFFLIFPIVVMKRILSRLFIKNSVQSDMKAVPSFLNMLLQGINWFEAKGLSYVSYPWGSSLFILARKPGGKK